MKKCERCKKNLATVHLTEIRNGKREEIHLCEQCARDLKVPHKTPLSVNDLLGILIEKEEQSGAARPGEDVKCPNCGITFSEFKKKGRFGCADDYRLFGEDLVPILKKIHGSSKYIGKVPASQNAQPVFLRELLALRKRLKEVIKSEEYEEAARVRDRIKELEKLAEGPGPGEDGGGEP